MGLFASRTRPAPPARPGARAELPEDLRAALPHGFSAVGEALASGTGSVDECAAVGLALGLEGVSLDEALDRLERTNRQVRGAVPTHADTRALALAWADATVGYLDRLGCEDPVTGLASLAHLQTRLAELYRGELREPGVPESHALVVVELAEPAPARRGTDVLAADLRTMRFAEVARSVLGVDRPLGRVARDRIVVLAARDAGLGDRVVLLRRMLARIRIGEPSAAVRVLALPDSADAAASVLARLARP